MTLYDLTRRSASLTLAVLLTAGLAAAAAGPAHADRPRLAAVERAATTSTHIVAGPGSTGATVTRIQQRLKVSEAKTVIVTKRVKVRVKVRKHGKTTYKTRYKTVHERKTVPVYGTYGPRTTQAVTTFQRNAGLPATGTVDDMTYVRLFPKPTVNAPADAAVAAAVLTLLNAERHKAGVAPFVGIDVTAQAAAQQHAATMAAQGGPSYHDGQYAQIVTRASYLPQFDPFDPRFVAQQLVDSWMRSPVHASFVVSSKPALVGIGIAHRTDGDASGYYAGYYAVVNFTAPPS